MDKYIPFDREELYIETNSINKPYYEDEDSLYVDDELVKEYHLRHNNYDRLNSTEKFVVSKKIIEYHLIYNINSRIKKICNEKKEFNSSLNSKTGHSKNAIQMKESMLRNLIGIIDFNDKILTKDRKRLDLLNDLFNNIIDKDYVSGNYNLDELSKSIKGFNIKGKEEIINDFIDYAYSKCSGVDNSNKFNKDYSIKYLKESKVINDVSGRKK